ncbi:hypothetical protein DSO57_1029895 [Entomophthora muscae]|uniref:Uncharacterized protein n=1 Tax=Entomophthora muscae TaxID=34485 RepID=A0ACC2UAS1_9FUNG|nr:hypothetical protein DSO57_1029895 [Entomophthora muscae]
MKHMLSLVGLGRITYSPEMTQPKATTCVRLPSLRELFPSMYTTPRKDGSLKSRRCRANQTQLTILNRIFRTTGFPSTQLRAALALQLGMSPRTIQIWFQNKRQSSRKKPT